VGVGLRPAGPAGYATLLLTNNLIVSHTTGIYVDPGSDNTAVADHTLFYGDGTDTGGRVITSTNEITGSDPRFVHSAGGTTISC
jgi:hypothetical protein